MRAGRAASRVSRRCGFGSGGIVGGRLTLAMAPSALAVLAGGRQVVVITGTNGKTTTSHLLAAAMRTSTPVAHNASGANMADGAVAALSTDPGAPVAVLEVDELHLRAVSQAVDPAVVVLLNLSRDQLDRGNEVRAVAAAVRSAIARLPRAVVVANNDDPMVVWAVRGAARVVWVSTGGAWDGDTVGCPACGRTLHRRPATRTWWCSCGLARPEPHWIADGTAAVSAQGSQPLRPALPGRVNHGNAATALATASLLGIDPGRAAAAIAGVNEVAGRYAVVTHRNQRLRMLLAKNPAGWAEMLRMLDRPWPLLLVVNAREADGRDTSWLWDVAFDKLAGRPVVASGEHAADLGVRLTYAGVAHLTVDDPLEALRALPPGPVDVVANYTAFHHLGRRLTAAGQLARP